VLATVVARALPASDIVTQRPWPLQGAPRATDQPGHLSRWHACPSKSGPQEQRPVVYAQLPLKEQSAAPECADVAVSGIENHGVPVGHARSLQSHAPPDHWSLHSHTGMWSLRLALQ
jgi:hypothetical protein